MSWWVVVLLCYLFYSLGVINATVAERERYWTWMSNSWEMVGRRLWWLKMVKTPSEAPTPQDYSQLTQHLIDVMNDYNGVFGRDYNREKLMPLDPIAGEIEESDE